MAHSTYYILSQLVSCIPNWIMNKKNKKIIRGGVLMRVNGQVWGGYNFVQVWYYNMDKSNKMTTKTNDTTSDNKHVTC
jgi:hypothetical protein